MPSDTPDQQITLPVGVDLAAVVAALISQTADLEGRLNLRYTDEADRTARHPVGVEGEYSYLQTENRGDAYNGAAWVSAHTLNFHTYARKTADQNVGPSNTVLTNVTNLLAALPGIAGAIFGFRGKIFYDTAAAADIKFAFTIPAAASMRWGLSGLAVNGTDPTYPTTGVSGTALPVGGLGLGTLLVTMFEGELTMGGTAGNLQLQAAQNTSDPTATTIYQRSHLEVWRIS